jgi:hypothetical protein
MHPAAYISIGYDRFKSSSTQSIELLLFIFFPSFLFFLFFLQLDLLAAATTSKVVVVHASPPFRRRLVGEGAPPRSPMTLLTTVSPDKIEQSDFYSFEQGFRSLFFSCGKFQQYTNCTVLYCSMTAVHCALLFCVLYTVPC